MTPFHTGKSRLDCLSKWLRCPRPYSEPLRQAARLDTNESPPGAPGPRGDAGTYLQSWSRALPGGQSVHRDGAPNRQSGGCRGLGGARGGRWAGRAFYAQGTACGAVARGINRSGPGSRPCCSQRDRRAADVRCAPSPAPALPADLRSRLPRLPWRSDQTPWAPGLLEVGSCCVCPSKLR